MAVVDIVGLDVADERKKREGDAAFYIKLCWSQKTINGH